MSFCQAPMISLAKPMEVAFLGSTWHCIYFPLPGAIVLHCAFFVLVWLSLFGSIMRLRDNTCYRFDTKNKR